MSVAGIDDDDDKWLLRVKFMAQDELDSELVESVCKKDPWRVNRLLEYGANASADTSLCLQYAVLAESCDMIERLVEAGADVNHRPFMCIALAYGYTEPAKTLYALGADPTLYHRGLDAHEWAFETGNIEMSAVLKGPRPEKPPTEAEKVTRTLSTAKKDGKKYKL